MNPVPSGGYAWVVFTTRRLYGNVATNNPWSSDPRFRDLTSTPTTKKLWVAAIDLNAPAGTDPSHPAIYITGQQQDSINERPQFTVNPCKPLGDTCDNGYDCCDGFCRAEDGGPPVCQKKKDNQCSGNGDACAVDGDCCAGLKCIGGFCSNPPK